MDRTFSPHSLIQDHKSTPCAWKKPWPQSMQACPVMQKTSKTGLLTGFHVFYRFLKIFRIDLLSAH